MLLARAIEILHLGTPKQPPQLDPDFSLGGPCFRQRTIVTLSRFGLRASRSTAKRGSLISVPKDSMIASRISRRVGSFPWNRTLTSDATTAEISSASEVSS